MQVAGYGLFPNLIYLESAYIFNIRVSRLSLLSAVLSTKTQILFGRLLI